MFEWDNYSWVSQGLPDGKHGVTGQAKKKKKDKGKKAAPNITYVHRWLRIKFSRFAAWLLRSLAISQSVIQFYFCTQLLFMIQITTPFYLGKALVSR